MKILTGVLCLFLCSCGGEDDMTFGRFQISKKVQKATCSGWDCEIDVLKAKSEMSDLIGYGERIRMDPELASNIGAAVGQQVKIRVKEDSDKYAIYTISAFYQDGTDDNDVRMALDGRQRLDQSDAFDGCVNEEAVLTGETLVWLESNDEYGEFLDETSTSHTDVVVCAPHGGIIENYTDDEARWFYDRINTYHSKDVTAWYAAGWQGEIGAYDAWHITSTEISRDSFTKLDQIGDRGFMYAVSFHGYSGSDILVGGGASLALKNEVKEAIENAVNNTYTVTVVTSGPYAGTSSANFVNWLTDSGDNGIQIEQPYGARRDYGQSIAEKVADVFAEKI
jgi:phage replication-related protein YjqB (UPF0714/DUF867 family)